MASAITTTTLAVGERLAAKHQATLRQIAALAAEVAAIGNAIDDLHTAIGVYGDTRQAQGHATAMVATNANPNRHLATVPTSNGRQ